MTRADLRRHTIFGRDLSQLDVNCLDIDNNLLGRACYLGVYLDSSLVSPVAADGEIVQRDMVVRWLSPVSVSAMLLSPYLLA